MLVSDAVTHIKRQFGDEYSVVIYEGDIYQYIYEAELDIIRKAGSNDQTVTVAVSAFPSNVPTAVTIKRVSISGKALQYTSKEQIDLNGLSVSSVGTPLFWYMQNKQVYLWPTDSSTTQVEITYNKTPTLMSGLPSANTFTVPEVYHTDIINFCLSRAFSKTGDDRKVQEYTELYDRNLGTRMNEANSIDAATYKLGDPMDFNEHDFEWL